MQFVHRIVRNSTTPKEAMPTAIIGVLFEVNMLIISSVTNNMLALVKHPRARNKLVVYAVKLTKFSCGSIVTSGGGVAFFHYTDWEALTVANASRESTD